MAPGKLGPAFLGDCHNLLEFLGMKNTPDKEPMSPWQGKSQTHHSHE